MFPHFPARCLRIPDPAREFGLQLTGGDELVEPESRLRGAMSTRGVEQTRREKDLLADLVMGDRP